jgi:hypothetical protein
MTDSKPSIQAHHIKHPMVRIVILAVMSIMLLMALEEEATDQVI